METLTGALTAVHVINSALWVGAVFMGAIIDPPALRRSANGHAFLMNFIIEQGIRVFPWVYTAMSLIFLTGIALIWLHPPQTSYQVVLLVLKFIALAVMAGNTLYGTLVTWPKMQFATPDEIPEMWQPYLIRAYVTLACGILAFALGVLVR